MVLLDLNQGDNVAYRYGVVFGYLGAKASIALGRDNPVDILAGQYMF
jgi:hypothetical protein